MIYLSGVVVSLITGLVAAPFLQARAEDKITLAPIFVAICSSVFSWLVLVVYLIAIAMEFGWCDKVLWKKGDK